jgi:predicted ArsR family transcriptional regulator
MNRQEALWKSTVAGVARMPDPNRKQKILDYLEDYGPVSSREMAEHFSVNVTTINAHMRELSSAGSVRRSGPYNMRQWRISI